MASRRNHTRALTCEKKNDQGFATVSSRTRDTDGKQKLKKINWKVSALESNVVLIGLGRRLFRNSFSNKKKINRKVSALESNVVLIRLGR